MATEESVHVFECAGESLVGLLARPSDRMAPHGVLMVVGGPQYRVGSHRQFLLLSRHLAAAGFPVMRFDYRGMGDSTGEHRDFEAIQDDLQAALDVFFRDVPQIRTVTLWGLCDAASANLFFAPGDRRITGLVLLNPWVRTPQGEARARVKHYYVERLASRDFWHKIFSGHFHFLSSLRSFCGAITGMRKPSPTGVAALPLPDRMLASLEQFSGRVLLILSGRDLTAQEFSDTVSASPRWQAALARPDCTQHRLEEADHTFSRKEWRDQVARWTTEWLGP